MLQTNYHDRVVTLRLLTGEEVMGKCVANTENSMILNRPVSIKIMQTQDKQLVPQMMDYDLSSGENVEFDLRTVVSRSISREAFATHYVKLTSPIITDTTPGIIT